MGIRQSIGSSLELKFIAGIRTHTQLKIGNKTNFIYCNKTTPPGLTITNTKSIPPLIKQGSQKCCFLCRFFCALLPSIQSSGTNTSTPVRCHLKDLLCHSDFMFQVLSYSCLKLDLTEKSAFSQLVFPSYKCDIKCITDRFIHRQSLHASMLLFNCRKKYV